MTYSEIEPHHPGYFGAKDSRYVGPIKRLVRIYQQAFIDTYYKMAFAKRCDRNHALIAVDKLNEKVLLFFDNYGIRLLF